MRSHPNLFRCVPALAAWVVWGAGMLHAQPANDLYANRTVVTGTIIVVTGSSDGATSEAGEPLHADEQGGHSVWWTWTAPFAGLATISTLGSDFDTLLGIYIGSSVSGLTEIASNDDDQGLTSRATLLVSAGQICQIAVDGYQGDSGNVLLHVQLREAQPLTNDMFADRLIVTGTNAVVTGSNFGATSEAGEPNHAGVGGGLSVWWSWTAPFTGMATITTAGSSFDTVLGVYAGATVSSLEEIASNDDDPGRSDNTSKVIFFATAGQTYQVAVDGFNGESGNIQLNFQLFPLQLAPAWQYPDPYGAPVNSTNFAGKVMLLNFWASWCEPCKAEMPDMVALQDKYRADGFVIIGATIWDALQDTVNFLATNPFGINYQIIISEPLQYAYGGIQGIPTTFIINRQNQIVRSYVGSQTGSTFEAAIVPLLYDNMLLAAQKNENQLVLSWPTNAATFLLESSATLTNPVWVQWPTGPTIVNGLNTVQTSLSGTNRYFQLRLQQ